MLTFGIGHRVPGGGGAIVEIFKRFVDGLDVTATASAITVRAIFPPLTGTGSPIDTRINQSDSVGFAADRAGYGKSVMIDLGHFVGFGFGL